VTSQVEFLPLVAKYWLYQAPFSILYVVGALMALRHGRHSSRFARLVLAGCLLSLVLNLTMPIAQVWYMRMLSARGESLYSNTVLDTLGVVANVISALAFALVLAAAFVDRSPRAGEGATPAPRI
jgi:hypothetical protein